MLPQYVINQNRSCQVLIENIDLLQYRQIGENVFTLEYHEPSLMQFNNHVLGEFDSISSCLLEIYNIKNCKHGFYHISGFIGDENCLAFGGLAIG